MCTTAPAIVQKNVQVEAVAHLDHVQMDMGFVAYVSTDFVPCAVR